MVVKVTEIFPHHNIVTENLEGFQPIFDKSYSERQAIKILQKVTNFVKYCHHKKILIRDIDP